MGLRLLVVAVALAVVGGFQARRLPLAPLCRGPRAGARLVLRASAGVQQQQQRQQPPPQPAASTFASKSRRLTARLTAWLVKSWSAGKLRVATALLVLGLVFGRVSSANAGFVTAAPAAGAAGSCRIVASAPAADSTTTATTTATAAAARQTRLGKSLSKIKQAPSTFIKEETDQIWRWGARAEKGAEAVLKDTEVEVEKTFRSLFTSLQGAKLDTLLLLIVTSAVIPIFKYYKTSSILGFLLFGTVLGPNCLNWLKDVHMIDMLGELGIVFFLFEIGLELSLERLVSMKKDVFGLGTSQFVLTSAAGAAISRAFGLSTAAAVTIGGSMALSSSAFVLQLLKDKSAMGSRVGRASFGILLLQDLAVVPLLVIVELLAKGGSGLGKALGIAGVKTVVAVSSMSFAGRKLLDPLFFFVARSSSQEAFLSIILTTVLLMSFITQGIGLSNTLGAFLAGLLLAETKYRYQVESDIAPFRGLLLGFFFITVGFSIDPRLFFTSLPQIVSLLALVLFSKASIITALSLANGMTFSEAQQTGILNAQVGEFAFVAFAIAERSSLISPKLNKILLTTVALSMALTPFLDKAGASIASKLEAGNALPGGLVITQAQDQTAKDAIPDHSLDNFVLVCGYGRVGKMVCDMLDKQLIPYVAIDNSPQRAKDARKLGLPVFFGDVNRPEVLKSFHAESARACVVAINDKAAISKAVASVRQLFPKLPIVARAINTAHQKRLEGDFEGVFALCPMLPEDSVLLTLPFGGAVLQKIGVSKPEIDAILEDFRERYMDGDAADFFTSFQRRLPPVALQPADGHGGDDGKGEGEGGRVGEAGGERVEVNDLVIGNIEDAESIIDIDAGDLDPPTVGEAIDAALLASNEKVME